MSTRDPLRTAAVLAAALAVCCTATLTRAADETEAAIRAVLTQWTVAFNARDASHICDLFAPDLRYDFRGLPERDYATLCSLLKRALSDTTRKLDYSPDIKEIIVSGDLAIVRLVWNVRMAVDGKTIETREPGLDVFRKQPDGTWKIVRYLAYEEP
jgi:steroid delta-isomerase